MYGEKAKTDVIRNKNKEDKVTFNNFINLTSIDLCYYNKDILEYLFENKKSCLKHKALYYLLNYG
jgi:hypothetical protein